jgi:predicted O-methyltransferase YrrM
VIVADNVVRNGSFVDAGAADASTRGVRRFFEMIATEPRVSVTAIQTVGCKRYDGFLLARVVG